ncbi:PaaI family thioesterase [Tenuifilum thalassicum]|uniref:PaaI family thioesterase n=1 Tax=Tenuifilum thalassicum TaxID=2590900 RepID=A0A7D3XV01_9BACT|nr:PaaI family thioesterase [Tenuifilum thalassicum]QKG79811.1 PaaI family thioesterase [Tenuifilum thalassicum]
MIKVKNPYEQLPEHGCFCCSSKNPIGLKLDFWFNEDENSVETRWNPDRNYQGYQGVLHGGIQSTLMDEVASWSIYILVGTAGVTHSMEIFYKKPLLIDKGEVIVRGKILKKEKRIVTVYVEIIDGKGETCTTGNIHYFTFPVEIAKSKYGFPGREAFL